MMYVIIGLLIILLFVNIFSLFKQKNVGTMYVSRQTAEGENVQVGLNFDSKMSEADIFGVITKAGKAAEMRLAFHNDRKIAMYEEAKKEAEEKKRLKAEGKVVDIAENDEAN